MTGLVYAGLCLNIAPATSQEIVHRIILVGDAGEIRNGKNAVIDAIRSKFPPDEKTTIIFLGDNIYPAGLPDENAKNFEEAKKIIDYQVGLARNTRAIAYFVPGNHDWAQGRPFGFEQQTRQQRYIDSLHFSNIRAIPTDGCPGPVEIVIDEKIVLIAVDTQWFLHGYDKPSIESNCPCKNEDEVLASLADILARNQNRLVLFASHHPFRTHGPHGGYFTIKQHIFPLTELSPGLYIPLPVIGSLYPITRGLFGNIQDTRHPLYKKMVSAAEKVLLQHPQVVFVSGHDHSLQWIKERRANYIVSGAGAKSSRVKKGKNSVFARQEYGFATIEFHSNNEVKLNFLGIEDGNLTGLLDTLLLTYKEIPDSAMVMTKRDFPDSVFMAADKQYNKARGFKRFMLGDNYRKVWATEMNFRTIDISSEKGGLKITQRGGGHQTKSLRLADSSGKEWVLRSMEKFPEAGIPAPLRRTFAVDIVQDQISAANPYGPLVIPTLAKAAKVPHTNPEIVYLPNDPRLGMHRSEFANNLMLFEEREPGTGNPRTYNTAKVLEEIQHDNDNTISQADVLRARILDFFIADWDRHDDQWRWIDEKKGGDKKFAPLPRDRDNAFFTNSGLIPGIAKFPWLLPFVQGFKPHIKNISGWNFGARYFDRSFLNEPNEETWKKEVGIFKANMTDEVIDDAVKKLPPAIYAQNGEKIRNTLKERKKYLEEEALEYYRFLAKTVTVPGSDKKEKFIVKGIDDNQLDIAVQKIDKEGVAGKNIYHRVFKAGETREIRLYGLKGNDELVVEGKIPAIIVRWVGGEGNDSLVANSTTVDAPKKIHVYDLSRENNSYTSAGFTRLHLSADPSTITYNRKEFKYNLTMPVFNFGFNQDDGFIFGAGLKHIGHGFRKEPQAVIHEVGARYAVSTGAFAFGYRGLFTDVIGKTDLAFNATIKAPDNTINFFGFGNETVYDKNGKRAYKNYRTSFTDIKTELLLRTNFSRTSYWSIGPAFEYYNMSIENNLGRIISVPPYQGLDSASIYDNKMYASIQSYLDFDTRKDVIMPTRGVRWLTSAQFAKGINDNSSDYIKLQSDFSLHLSFNIPARVILSNRIGGGTIFGDFEFFQAHTLGNNFNMRGYRNYRFAGRSALYNNTELRLKLFDFDSYLLPGSLGLIGFFDIGRVWYDDEDSKTWHKGYGGGIYLSPVNRLIMTLTYGMSKEDKLPDFSLGFKF